MQLKLVLQMIFIAWTETGMDPLHLHMHRALSGAVRLARQQPWLDPRRTEALLALFAGIAMVLLCMSAVVSGAGMVIALRLKARSGWVHSSKGLTFLRCRPWMICLTASDAIWRQLQRIRNMQLPEAVGHLDATKSGCAPGRGPEHDPDGAEAGPCCGPARRHHLETACALQKTGREDRRCLGLCIPGRLPPLWATLARQLPPVQGPPQDLSTHPTQRSSRGELPERARLRLAAVCLLALSCLAAICAQMLQRGLHKLRTAWTLFLLMIITSRWRLMEKEVKKKEEKRRRTSRMEMIPLPRIFRTILHPTAPQRATTSFHHFPCSASARSTPAGMDWDTRPKPRTDSTSAAVKNCLDFAQGQTSHMLWIASCAWHFSLRQASMGVSTLLRPRDGLSLGKRLFKQGLDFLLGLLVCLFCRNQQRELDQGRIAMTAASTTSHVLSRPGPKSRCRSSRFSRNWCSLQVGLFFWLMVFFILPTQVTAATDARVSGSPTGPLGVCPSGRAKHRGASRATLSAATLPAARKRSYRRAVHRAMKNGSTTYRGKVFTCSEIEHLNITHSHHRSATRFPRTPPESKRIRILSVNFDGVTTATYDSFAQWLQTAPHDVLLMQETHRGFGAEYAEWEIGDWMLVSSPDRTSRFAGIAIAVRKSLVKGWAVRSIEVVQGRLLHVRISGDKFGIDIITCYQHVISSREPQQKTAAKREAIWSAVGRHLASLPRRNVLILGGDLNCSARPQAGIAGHCAPPASDYYFDQDELMGLAEANGLCFLNTWQRPRQGSMNTFIAGMANSQIDYVLTRRSQADSFAKGAAPLPSLDFSPWRLGARHCPIRATVPLKPGWISSPRRQAPQITYNKLDLEHSIRSNDLRARSLYAEVQARLQQLDEYTAESLNTALLDSCSCIYPRSHTARQPRPWQQPAVQHSVQTMWAHRRLMSRIGHDVRYGLFSVRHVFAAFRAYAQFQRSYRALRTQGRWYRRKLLVDKMLRATQAERSKDARALYQVIREISPIQNGGKVRIRSTDGHLLNPEEEHVEISGYFFQLFGADKPDVQATARLQPIEIYPEELELSLKRLGPGKAVPVGSAPSSAWRYCRSLLSGPLADAFQEGTMAGYPSRWADCSLTLIPKPNKTNKRPESLRPLGIQDAAGKAVSRVLKQKLFPQIRAALESYPQFAYLEGRSTSDAIQRVVAHCDRIRGKLSNDKHNLRHRKAGKKRLKYQGGAQLTLDMSAAFDRLPRQALEDSLRWAGADEETISILIDMHCACHYKIVHEGFVAYIDMRNGVRQGCTVAPILWATYSVYLLHLKESQA